ncbi:MAG: hypothetical protein ACLTC4_20715 [Hungatella hathewayi]
MRCLERITQETVDKMADTTEGYRKGFEVMGRDISRKTVAIRCELGFERMVRGSENFRHGHGADSVPPGGVVHQPNPNRKIGFRRRPTSSMIMTTGMTAPSI